MLKNYKQRKQEGFTIIEVLIVLAIAGLIMLVVFLAVPALQRNTRNSARSTEASRISTAVTDCMANRNGTIGSCDTTGEISIAPATDLQQFTAINFTTTGTGAAPGSGTETVGVWFGRTCMPDGSGSQPSVDTRRFVVLFTSEPAVTRCIGS